MKRGQDGRRQSAGGATSQQGSRDLVWKLAGRNDSRGGRQVASNYCKQLRLMRRLTPPVGGWCERGCKCADAE